MMYSLEQSALETSSVALDQFTLKDTPEFRKMKLAIDEHVRYLKQNSRFVSSNMRRENRFLLQLVRQLAVVESQGCRMDSLMNVYKWFRKNRIVSSQPAQQQPSDGTDFPFLKTSSLSYNDAASGQHPAAAVTDDTRLIVTEGRGHQLCVDVSDTAGQLADSEWRVLSENLQRASPERDDGERAHACTPVSPVSTCSGDGLGLPDTESNIAIHCAVDDPTCASANAAEQLEKNRDFLQEEKWMIGNLSDVTITVADLLPDVADSSTILSSRKKSPTITNISFNHHGNEKMAKKLIQLVDTLADRQTDNGKPRHPVRTAEVDWSLSPPMLGVQGRPKHPGFRNTSQHSYSSTKRPPSDAVKLLHQKQVPAIISRDTSSISHLLTSYRLLVDDVTSQIATLTDNCDSEMSTELRSFNIAAAKPPQKDDLRLALQSLIAETCLQRAPPPAPPSSPSTVRRKHTQDLRRRRSSLYPADARRPLVAAPPPTGGTGPAADDEGHLLDALTVRPALRGLHQASSEWEDLNVELELPATSSRREVVGRHRPRRPPTRPPREARVNHQSTSMAGVAADRPPPMAEVMSIRSVCVHRKDSDVTSRRGGTANTTTLCGRGPYGDRLKQSSVSLPHSMALRRNGSLNSTVVRGLPSRVVQTSPFYQQQLPVVVGVKAQTTGGHNRYKTTSTGPSRTSRTGKQ